MTDVEQAGFGLLHEFRYKRRVHRLFIAMSYLLLYPHEFVNETIRTSKRLWKQARHYVAGSGDAPAGKTEMAKDEKAANQPSGIAEEAMEHARRAADAYCDFVKQAIAATPSGGNEFAERIKGYAEKNITMTQEYLRQLSQARNFQDMVRIQADFMQSLMNAFGEQSLGEAYKAAADMAKKPTSSMS